VGLRGGERIAVPGQQRQSDHEHERCHGGDCGHPVTRVHQRFATRTPLQCGDKTPLRVVHRMERDIARRLHRISEGNGKLFIGDVRHGMTSVA
jgi:hypothetical protein